MSEPRPLPHELWQQAKGDRAEYRRLMIEHGHLVPKAASQQRVERGGRSTHLLLADFERLERWCHDVREIFGREPYLVGSALNRPDYRDIDLRLILPDRDFDRAYKGKPVRVRLMNRAISTWGQRETGLPIDFQIQRQTEANAAFDGPRNPMGMRDWSLMPPSGTPGGRNH